MYKASNQVGRQHGYIRVSELSDRKKYRRVLKAVDAGELVKVRHGVYAPPEEMLNNIIDVESIVPGGVVCLYNAWELIGNLALFRELRRWFCKRLQSFFPIFSISPNIA